MKGSWALAIFLWVTLAVVIIGIFVHEANKTPEQRKRDSEMARERYEKDCLSRKIVAVTPLGVSGIQHKRGGLGAVLQSGKSVPVQQFAVKYGNGEVVIRECMQGSSEYKALMKYVVK